MGEGKVPITDQEATLWKSSALQGAELINGVMQDIALAMNMMNLLQSYTKLLIFGNI